MGSGLYLSKYSIPGKWNQFLIHEKSGRVNKPSEKCEHQLYNKLSRYFLNQRTSVIRDTVTMLNQINIKLVQNPAVILLFILQLLVYENVSSQVPYNIVNYSNNEGFNQNTIFAIEQDKLGFLWIGTSNGLIRYDGYDFLNYSSIQSFPADIPRDRIKDIYSSGDGLL